MELLNGNQLQVYLGISADTLRRIREEDSTFPGFFTRKLYSKPEIDAWLRKRIPENYSENIDFDISAEVENTLAELFSTSRKVEGSRGVLSPPGRMSARPGASA